MVTDTAFIHPHTAFARYQRVASGPLPVVALAVKQVSERGATAPILIYDDVTGRAIDIDTRGSDEEVVARLSGSLVSKLLPRSSNRGRAAMPPFSPPVSEEPRAGQPRGPGRPKLGVVAREVTLLPRHWEWLNKQPGGASVALRKLVEEARRTHHGKDRRRQAQEAAFSFMSSIAGDLPGFEEAIRALFADDQPRFRHLIAPWPEDVRAHACKLAFADPNPFESPNR